METPRPADRGRLLQVAKLLDGASTRRAKAHRRVLAARAALDEAETELHELDNALNTFGQIAREALES